MQRIPARVWNEAPHFRSLRLVGAPAPSWVGRLAAATQAWAAHPATLATLLFLVAIVSRAAQFGNPVVQVDDEFYLLTGDRMLHGALPYVDIWDRKPIGLFLIYAGIRLLGGEGVLQYQLVATLFAAATGFGVARIARTLTGPHGAAAAGVVYVLYLGVLGGDGGQSPVFYNLLVVMAVLAMVWAIRPSATVYRFFAAGLVAMLFTGLAMQVKYSAVFEGLFFGLALLWFAWQRGVRPVLLAAMASIWILGALLPTLAAWAWYTAIGHGDAFVQANFLSILDRSSDGFAISLKRLGWILLCQAPLGLAAWFGAGLARATDDLRRLLQGWAIAAVGGVLVFGTYFDHYALPLIAPLCVLAAPWFGDSEAGLSLVSSRRRWHLPAGAATMALVAALSLTIVNDNRRDRGWGPQVAQMAAFIRPQLTDCLFVFDGEPALYRLTESCLPTRWSFPSHLNLTREAPAIGVDPLAELKRIMAAHPQFVVASTRPDRDLNPEALAYMTAVLARDYVPALEVPVGSRSRIVYRRRAID